MLLNLTAYVIIPIYTLLFVKNTNWLTSNLSVIGSGPSRKTSFFILGVIIGLYYHTIVERLLRYLPYRKLEHFLAHLALLLLLLAVSTPYLPDTFPFEAFLHVIFAFAASVIFLLCLYLIVWKLSGLSKENRFLFRPYRIRLIFITLVSALLLLIAGIISTALELFFVIATTLTVQKLHHHCTCIFTPRV